jgi:hypothetical protein
MQLVRSIKTNWEPHFHHAMCGAARDGSQSTNNKGFGMNTLAFDPCAGKVSFDADNIWVEPTDGRQLAVPPAYFPRLLNATSVQREGFIISGGGGGIHWDDLDEDISVIALLLGVGDRTRPARQAS